MKILPIHVIAKWQVKEGELSQVLELLPELVQKTRNEKGNLSYHIYQSHSDTHTLLLSEAYADEKALDEHRSAEHFREIVIKQIVPLLEKREVELTTELMLNQNTAL